ncbi:MAG: hypothetical protein HY322_08675 [Betaproteobacteria bacterium]|nr:hypothetical protein [Betaproteobacteria bacterium]
MAIMAGACATVAPVPVTVDTGVPAVVETDGLRATLHVLPRSEVGRVFGVGTGAQLGVVELKVENRGALPMSVERKWIRILTPAGQEVYPVSPLGIANLTRGQAMISTGSNALDAVQLLFGLALLAQNYHYSAKWDPLMPETFKVAAGEERRMLIAFPTPHWAPGLWRLELPFNTDTGATGPHLSIPLRFKEVSGKRTSLIRFALDGVESEGRK